MNAIIRTRTAFQNALDREASKIEKLTRAVNAQYAGTVVTEISTGISGVIRELTYEPSIWNKQTATSGCWNVAIEVEGYGFLNLPPYAIELGSK